jgi:hypothetical protein
MLPDSQPPTVSTPGIVAGAPTRLVPLPLLPAATMTTTSLSNAYWNASSQVSSQSRVFVVKERLITSAPLSTDQWMASAICWMNDTEEVPPNPTETDRSSASGATPIIPRPSPVPRAPAREATQLPCARSVPPTGVRPSGVPTPETSVPPATAPANSTGPDAMPVSMIAIRVPAPRVVFHASRMPYWSSQYSAALTPSAGSSATGGAGVAAPTSVPATTTARAAAAKRFMPPLPGSRRRTAQATRWSVRGRGRRWDSPPGRRRARGPPGRGGI